MVNIKAHRSIELEINGQKRKIEIETSEDKIRFIFNLPSFAGICYNCEQKLKERITFDIDAKILKMIDTDLVVIEKKRSKNV